METQYRVMFNIVGLDQSIFGKIENIGKVMGDELIRVYNIYATETNNGVTAKLNEEFRAMNPTYFEDNKGKEWYDMTEYNSYLAEGFQRLVVDKFNLNRLSEILDFYVDKEEIQFTGVLKYDKNVKIDFSLKPV